MCRSVDMPYVTTMDIVREAQRKSNLCITRSEVLKQEDMVARSKRTGMHTDEQVAEKAGRPGNYESGKKNKAMRWKNAKEKVYGELYEALGNRDKRT